MSRDNKKKDLAKIFGVEELITSKDISHKSLEEIKEDSPFVASEEIKELIDNITKGALTKDINMILKSIEGIEKRTSYMKEVALNLKKIIDNSGQL